MLNWKIEGMKEKTKDSLQISNLHGWKQIVKAYGELAHEHVKVWHVTLRPKSTNYT